MPPTVIKADSGCETVVSGHGVRSSKHGRSLTLDAETLIASSPYRVCKKTKTTTSGTASVVVVEDILSSPSSSSPSSPSPSSSSLPSSSLDGDGDGGAAGKENTKTNVAAVSVSSPSAASAAASAVVTVAAAAAGMAVGLSLVHGDEATRRRDVDSCGLSSPRAPSAVSRERRQSSDSDDDEQAVYHARPAHYHAQGPPRVHASQGGVPTVGGAASTLAVDDAHCRSRSNSAASHTRRRSTVDDEDRDLLFSPMAHEETGENVCHHHLAQQHQQQQHLAHANAKVMEEYISANGHSHLSYTEHGRHVDVDIDASLSSSDAVVVRDYGDECVAVADSCVGVEHVDETEEEEEYGEFDPYHFISRLPPPSKEQLARTPLLASKAVCSPKVTLVLDLDETLVHCATEPISECDFTFNVVFNEVDYNIYVRKRPYMDEFIRRVADQFELVIFTASQQVYADRLLDLLDPERTWSKNRLFRDACVNVEGNFVKDLTILGRDMSSVVIVDNSPHAYGFQIDNGIPIESWFDDDDDTELLKTADFLLTITDAADVRPPVRDMYAQRALVEAHLPVVPGTQTHAL